MQKVKKEKIQFTCQTCGKVSLRWLGRCDECDSWNSFIEETVPLKVTSNRASSKSPAPPTVLSAVEFNHHQRMKARSDEFNRVLGGGIVSGSLILLGGDPGIGKSTLMLQEGVAMARKELPVLYISGEESVQQTKLRAKRLDLNSDFLFIYAENDINQIIASIEKIKPQLVIVDSIQTAYQPAFESTPGSISQVRECALELSRVARQQNVAIVLVGHVTKEGHVAGPKVLEHMVDVLLQFEGDREHFYRILRTVKNRFGSTREIGIFEMTGKGLQEVENPSAQFLEQRKENISGSSVICTLEGTRPFLVEIQALVSPTSYGLPQRSTTGIDNKRLALLLAVLEKRIGLRVGTHDVFVNAAGGVRVDEPAADLGILMSIASSFKDQIITPEAIIVGEVGLGGEIRSVPQITKRLEEASKLGFTKAIIPKQAQKGLQKQISLNILPVESADEAIAEVLN